MTKTKPTVKEIFGDLDDKAPFPIFGEIEKEANAAGEYWITYLMEHYPDLGDIMHRMIESALRAAGRLK